jgi:serine/threonine protein phosphatase 1
MQRVFAIGDIHGCCKTFRKLVFEEIRITSSDTIYCIGDYIDRGPDSKGVIDLILELRKSGYQIYTLRGNHEQLLLDSASGGENYDIWMVNGGRQTLASFGVNSYDELTEEYKTFFSQTEYYIQTHTCIFVHAGLDFTSGDPFENTDAMLWMRVTVVDDSVLGERIIVHGHTPLPADIIPTQRASKVINIDGGCVYPHRTGYGYLFAFEVNSMEFISVKNVDF